MGNTDSIVYMLGGIIFNGMVIFMAKDVKPMFFRLILLFFLFYLMQSNIVLLAKPLGYPFQIADSAKISISIFLAWFTSLLDQNKRVSGSSNQSRQRTYLDVVTDLLHGDQNAAIRLFNYNKQKFGGKSDEWLWQKVIRDIERDRQ